MPIRCPSCATPPPRDPFLCTNCGEHLLTYLDEPFGPATGVRADRPGVGVGAGAGAAGWTGAPNSAGFAAGQAPPGAAGDPIPAGFEGGQTPQPVVTRRPDNTGPFILKLLFGLFIALIMAIQELIGGMLFTLALAFGLWRWPRAPIFLFSLGLVGVAATIWTAVELIDLLDSPPPISPTPVPVRSVSTPTIAVSGTPTLAPAARTATATVVAGQNRVRLSRAKARWLRGDNATALTELNEALTVVPGLPEALNLRALVRISNGDYQGAADDAERAVSAQPSNLSHRDTQAYAWLKLGRYDDAIDEYDGVLAGSIPENRALGHLGRGIARAALGRVDGARADLDMGLRLLPDSEPDPQSTDLEIAARRALEQLPPSPASPSPAASPASPAASSGPERYLEPAGSAAVPAAPVHTAGVRSRWNRAVASERSGRDGRAPSTPDSSIILLTASATGVLATALWGESS